MSEGFLIWLKARRQELVRELAELEVAERLYVQSHSPSSNKPQQSLPLEADFLLAEKANQKIDEADKKPKTIKQAVLIELNNSVEKKLTASEILARLQINYDPTLVRTSLSPQLSRLQQEGKIRSERPYWHLA